MGKKPIRHKSGAKEIYPMYNLLMKKLPNALQRIGVEYNLPTSLDNEKQAYKMAYEATRASIESAETIEIDGKTCYKVNIHRVGLKFDSFLAIDIDCDNFDIALFAGRIIDSFGYPFAVQKTNHGYWLVGTKQYTNHEDWLYDNCRILKNDLKREELKSYIEALIKFDKEHNDIREIRNSPLFNSKFTFDVAFTVLSIKRGKHTLRISKKFR